MTKYSVLVAGNNRYGNIIKNCFIKIQTAKLKVACMAGVKLKRWKGKGRERKERAPL